MNSRLNRIEEVFNRAVAAPSADRDALVREACAGDDELRAEIEALLAHDASGADGWFGQPAVEVVQTRDGDPGWASGLIGRKVGRYEVVRVLGTGGMGCVFEAKQERPARPVALKVVHPGLSAASALARFRLEPEILGRLRHPNIAQVYEAGVHEMHEGLIPYFAMELVPDAKKLRSYAGEHGANTRQLLELFAKVCDAVHHGHQKGIIHRDLKSANILVGADGNPKIIDFGVARSTDADIMLTTHCTRAGDIVGTLPYMSPEQVDGNPEKIDMRSDVYSLGAVLHELLTGQTPFDLAGKTVYAAMRVIKEESPRLPSTRCGPDRRAARRLRGNLDAIVLRAIEREPAARYSSAADLATDIRKHLAGDLISARPQGRWRRLLLWAARRPAVAAAVGTVLVCGLTLAGAAIGTSLYVRHYLREPVEMVSDDRDHSVSLLSRSGTPIHTWRAGDSGGAAGLLITPFADDERRKLALVGFGTGSLADRAGQLQVYDVNTGLDQPLWTWQMDDPQIPADLPGPPVTAGQFSPSRHYWAFDVFPEMPASGVKEIVCDFAHDDNSLRDLCIFSVDGELLYNIWNDGGIFSSFWASQSGLLICGAENWDMAPYERGCTEATPGAETMLVVFALRPGRRMTEPRFVSQLATEGSREIAWYKWLSLCPIPNVSWGWSISRPTSGSPAAVAQLNLNFNTQPPCFMTWDIDANGDRVGPIRAPTYRTVRKKYPELPPVAAFELQDTPPGS